MDNKPPSVTDRHQEFSAITQRQPPVGHQEPEGCTYLDLISVNGAADCKRVADRWADRNDDDPQGKLKGRSE